MLRIPDHERRLQVLNQATCRSGYSYCTECTWAIPSMHTPTHAQTRSTCKDKSGETQTFPRQKNGFRQHTNFFLGKNGSGPKNQLFPRKKMVLDRKTNFFLGKTKKNQKKNIFWETIWPNSKKMVFLVFPRKKLVFGGKTNFFLGKRWFLTKKPTFS